MNDSSVVYLNNAGQAPLSKASKDAGVEAVGCLPWEPHAADDQAVIRRHFASLLNADAQRIAIMPSTAFAITLAANNIIRNSTKQQEKVLLLQDQMCSAVYPWEQNGAFALSILQYPTTQGGWTDAVLNTLENDDDITVACLPQLHWADGALLDLNAIGNSCRARNVKLVIDATQSIGIMPFNVTTIQPTFVACSTHKWLRGPVGCSLVYISQDVQDSWQPLDQHGRSRKIAIDGGSSWDASKDEMGPNGYPTELCNDARKFDSGGKPNPILLPILRASLQQVVQLDVQKAQQDLKLLIQPVLDWASRNGFVLTPGPHAGHLIGIRPSASSTLTPKQMIEIANKLAGDNNIYVAVRCGAFRISPYIDTTESDIQRLLEVLGRYCGS
jgi:selenocysteine lyase/cysteine desulfurase